LDKVHRSYWWKVSN